MMHMHIRKESQSKLQNPRAHQRLRAIKTNLCVESKFSSKQNKFLYSHADCSSSNRPSLALFSTNKNTEYQRVQNILRLITVTYETNQKGFNVKVRLTALNGFLLLWLMHPRSQACLANTQCRKKSKNKRIQAQ